MNSWPKVINDSADDTNVSKMGWKYRKWKFGQGYKPCQLRKLQKEWKFELVK